MGLGPEALQGLRGVSPCRDARFVRQEVCESLVSQNIGDNNKACVFVLISHALGVHRILQPALRP
jgi:hypothetical protein